MLKLIIFFTLSSFPSKPCFSGLSEIIFLLSILAERRMQLNYFRRYKLPMKKKILVTGICALCFLLPTVPIRAEITGRQQAEKQSAAQQRDMDRALQLLDEGNRLRAEGSREALLQAIELYKESAAILYELDAHLHRAYMLLDIGFTYDSISEKDKTLDYYEQALLIQREVPDRSGEADTLNRIGFVYSSIGEKDKALDYYEQALLIQREIPNRSGEAVALNNIGFVYSSIGEQDKALDYYEQALHIRREVLDRQGEAATLNNIGFVYSSIGEQDKALDYYEQALLIQREVLDRQGEAATLNNIGFVYSSIGEKDKALEYYEQALHILREVQDRKGEANTLNNIGSVYSSIGEQDKALEYYEQALPIRRAVQDRSGEADTLNNIGSVYNSIGEKDKALEYYEQALPIRRAVQDRSGEANTLDNIGGMYDSIGEKDKALEYYEQALLIQRAVKNKSGEAVTLSNIGLVYDSIGEKDKALEYYEQALPIRRAVQDRSGEAATLNNIGSVYNSTEEKEKALEYYEQALPILRAVKDRSGEANALNNIGSVYNSTEEQEKALEYYEQALPILRAVKNKSGEANTLNNIGFVYNSTGEQDKALEYYEQALPILREVKNKSGEANTLGNIAVLKKEQNDLQQALDNIRLAISCIEGIRTNISSSDLRESYFATVQDYYQLKTDILMQLDQPEAAFETSEAARARVLLELLNEANVNIREGVPPELLAEENELKRELLITDQKYGLLRSGEHTYEEAAELDKESENLLQQLDRTLSKIRQISPAYADISQPKPLLLQQIQQQVLDADTVLLQYSLGESQSYLWVVGANSFQSYVLPGQGDIETAARQFRSATTTDSSTSDVNRKGKELAELILPNLPEWTDGKRLVVSGDGVLSELAFGAIPLPGSEPYTPLLVNHEILTQSSISSIDILRQQFADRTALPTSIALLADPVYQAQDNRVNGNQIEGALAPTTERNMRDLDLRAINRLPYTRTEADAILKTANNLETLAAFDFDANYDWATDPILSEYSIVHMATHGFINPVNPQLSGVVLNLVTPDGELTNNGFLRLHDIFNLKLDAELVVLSACQTGLGENIGGEGIVGLSRGFMYAGAERVMVSLWNVNDESTATLMSTFYRYLLEEDMTPAAALRAAQKVQWEAGEIPYKWAAFTLQGEWQ